jgi:serine/threonine protein kinase
LGYAAPEYIQTGHLTAKSDVWSFGVVLLEILSGRRSLDKNRPGHEQNMLRWAKPWLQGNRRIEHMMDPKLVGGEGGGYSQVQADRVLKLARECLNKYPRERPRMSIIVQKLKEIVDLNDPYVVQAVADGDLAATNQPIRLKRHRRRSCVRWIIEAAVCN